MRRVLLLVMLLAAGQAQCAEPGLLGLLGSDSVTTHTIAAGPGPTHPLAYTATAGTLPLFDGSGARLASVFYVSYVRSGAAAERPVTFVFNGGPGAASAYLHLGLVGPRLLRFGDAHDGASAILQDNPQTWLDFTDLVMVDPIGTGWSRAAKPEDNQHYWGVRQDADTLAKVVALWLTHAGRSASPKFLLGESYGGLRAIKLAEALQREQGIVVSGLLMISPLLDGALTFGGDRLALGAALKLPSLAAGTAMREHRFTPESQAAAARFAMTDYLTTLAGSPPSGPAAETFYAQVAALTGVAPDIVARTHGFLGRAALHPGTAELSAYDASIGMDAAFTGGPGHGDAILDGFTRAFGGTFVGYAHDELGFRTDVTYMLLNGDVSHRWDWHSDGGALDPPRADDDLRDLLAVDSGMRVMIASGYTDLVTPYEAVRYIVAHMGAAPGRVATKVYPGGHMIYLDDASRIALTLDAREVISGQSPVASDQ